MLGQSSTAVRHRLPFTLPRIPVETTVDDIVLTKMFDRIRKEWERLGKTEPYWSVITDAKYLESEFESNREEFYLSGKHSCELFLSALRRNGCNPAKFRDCLEVGSGVGRVTSHLARNFSRVIAADISVDHLNLTRTYLAKSGISNVELRHWNDPLQLAHLPKVDTIFSVITLQHNPPPVMIWMLKRLFHCLSDGGVAYLQIPTYKNGYLFEVERYMNTSPSSTLEMHFLPQYEIFRAIDSSGCICLEIREDQMIGDEGESLSNTFLVRKVKS